jgi:hypothetical protein
MILVRAAAAHPDDAAVRTKTTAPAKVSHLLGCEKICFMASPP